MPVAMSARMSEAEHQLVRRMHFDQKKKPAEIAAATGRNLSSICRALQKKSYVYKKPGPKTMITEAQAARLEAQLNKMVAKADGAKEVTLPILKKASRLKAGEKTIQRVLHKRGIYFRKMRSKLILSKEDIKARYDFAKKYKNKSPQWWRKKLHMVIDLKHFQVYVNGQGRHVAAQREIRGVYRKRGQGLNQGYVRRPKELRYNPGAKGVTVAAGVGYGKVRLWHAIDGSWTGAKAAELYSGPLSKALKKAHPGRKQFTILEDNDPTGFRSKSGIEAKAAAGISVFRIPPRSPDLNVLDYAVWRQVTAKMREAEKSWPSRKKESRQDHVARLRRTALKLPKSFVDKAIGNMAKRCKRLYDAEGGHFEEGGV